MAQGWATIAGNIAEAMRGNLLDSLILPAAPLTLVALVALPFTRRWPSLRQASPFAVLLLSGLLTFLATSIVFPVATRWGTFLHASGPLLVGLVVCVALGLDRAVARLGRWRGWARPNVILPAVLVIGLTLPLAVFQVRVLAVQTAGVRDDFQAIATTLAAQPELADPRRPILTDHPIWLAELLRRPALALPDESPAEVWRLASTFDAGLVAPCATPAAATPDAFVGPRSTGRACFTERPVRHGRIPAVRAPSDVPDTMNPQERLADDRAGNRYAPSGRPGAEDPRPYTRPKMVRGTLGDEREVEFDGLYADAKQTLSSATNRLRATTQRFREAYATAATRVATPSRPGHRPAIRRDERDRLGDGLAREPGPASPGSSWRPTTSSGAWLFLERGRRRPSTMRPDPSRTGRPPSLRLHVLEAQESERSRLAEDLHDGPAQALANALFQIEIIRRTLQRDPASTEAEVRSLQALLKRELDAVRDYISQLRPALLEEGDLDAALGDAVDELTAAGIAVEIDLAAPDAILDGPRRTVALRIAQEAMRNARKHSGAKHVRLRTRLEEGVGSGTTWVLEVRDDGRGFDPRETLGKGSRRHFGLRFMRERADLIGARLEIEPDASSGTLVRLTIEDTERSQ